MSTTKKRKPMQVSVETIIENAGMTADYLAAISEDEPFHLAVNNDPLQKLVIEYVGAGETAVSHVCIQNGDLMRDPEIVFNSNWLPIEITQSPVGIYHRLPDELVASGRYSVSMNALANVWARNLRAQGFTGDDVVFSSLTSKKFDGGA